MPRLIFTSTKAKPGKAQAPQKLLWRIHERIGDVGVIVFPNGKRITGFQLRQCAFPDFRAAHWTRLAGDTDWSSFVELMADLADALEAYRGATNRRVLRIPPEYAPSLSPAGYAEGVTFDIDLADAAPSTGPILSVAPAAPAAPAAMAAFTAPPPPVLARPGPAEAEREQVAESAARAGAHALRAALRSFFTDHDTIVRVLNQSSVMVKRICEVYAAEGSWSGNGLWADITYYAAARYVEMIGALLSRAGVSLGQPRVVYLRNARRGHDPHWIEAKPAVRTAVPGTRIEYALAEPPAIRSVDSRYTYQWLYLNDPDAGKRAGEPAVVFGGEAPSSEAVGKLAGNHRVLCRVQLWTRRPGLFGGDEGGTPEYVEYPQTVSSTGDVLTAALAKTSAPLDPADQLRLVRGYREAVLLAEQRPGSRKLDGKVKEGLDRQVEKLEDKLKSSEGKKRYSIRAVHVASETAAVSELTAFVARLSASEGRETWTLVDITNAADRRLTGEYTGTGKGTLGGILAAIHAWDSGNRYPKGQIRVKIPDEAGEAFDWDFQTDGASFWDAIAEFFNQVGFWAGLASLGSAALLTIAPDPTVSKVAAVALWTSILAGTTGAAINIAQRHAEHMATFSEDAFDVVLIASNILGARWAIGATVKGLSLAGTRMGTAVVIGHFAMDAAQGVLLSIEYQQQYEEILADPDPKSRVDRLLALIRSAVVSGALLILSLRGSKENLSELRRRGKVDLRELGNQKQTIDVSPNEVQAKAKAEAEAKAKAEAEAKAKAKIEAEAKAKRFPGEAPEAWQKAVAKRQEPFIAGLAAIHGVTPAKYRAIVNAYLKKLLRRAVIYKRVSVTDLEKILVDSRFKSLFETNTSGGATNIQWRERIESNVFGFDGTKTPVEQRPQYGYLSARLDGTHPGVNQYGDTTIRFKPEVRERATFMFGDSLDSTRGGTHTALSPKPVKAPEVSAYDFDPPSYGYGSKAPPIDPTDLKSLDEFLPYVEVQIHGGLDVHSIAEVIFDGAPPPHVAARLDQLHIPWRVK